MGRIRRSWRGRENAGSRLIRGTPPSSSGGGDDGRQRAGTAAMGDGGAMGGRTAAAGRQDGRAAAAGQGDGVSPSYLLDFNERDIPHTTGIHKQVGEPKKVRKIVSTFCVPKKVRSEGSPFSPPFFQSWNIFKRYIRRFGEETGKKKVTCNHRPKKAMRSFSENAL
jgi:hypothetical protein